MTPMLANIVVDYFDQGGPIMWPILLALLAALTVVLERSLWWWSLRQRTRSGRPLQRQLRRHRRRRISMRHWS